MTWRRDFRIPRARAASSGGGSGRGAGNGLAIELVFFFLVFYSLTEVGVCKRPPLYSCYFDGQVGRLPPALLEIKTDDLS